mgnify:CR=1 FL=1
MKPRPSSTNFSAQRAQQLGKQTLDIEAAAISALKARINDDFSRAVECILTSRGRVIVSGMGKSGHVARKIAASVRQLGVQRFDLKYASGPMPHEQLMRSIELYATRVVPLVKDMLA